MNAKDLKPIGTLAREMGVKMLAYGPPGAGKTPLVETAPRPVVVVHEPGLLSARGLKAPAFEAYTAERAREFYKWFFESREADSFDTLCVDSVSELASIFLREAEESNKHGLKAYGEMAEEVMKKIVRPAFFMPRKHMYLICKMDATPDAANVRMRRPAFPGNVLNVEIPHLYDEIAFIAKQPVPGIVGDTLAIRCQPAFDILARDRSGMLAEFEPPNLAALFAKCMAQPATR